MRLGSRLAGGIVAAALITAAASPAAARGWGWRGPLPRYHHDRGPSAGAVIGAIAAVGILAAVASSAARKRDAEQRRYEDAPPYDRAAEDRYADRDDEPYRYDTPADSPRYDDSAADPGEQDAAVNACVLAARDEAGRNGDYAEVRGVTGISRLGSGWDISGRVEQRATFSAIDSWQRNFRCAWQNGRVSAVSLD